jgi:hypothetical protein
MNRNTKGKNPILGIIILGVILTFFIHLQYTTYKRAFIQRDKLTQVKGVISNVQKIKFGRGNLSNAYVLTIKDIPISFAIQDNDFEAYSFIELNEVIGKKIELLYDNNDFDSDENLTYHVYKMNINNRNILSIDETTRFYKIAFFALFIVPIFFITMIAYQKRTKHNNKYT